ncbi:hypothetical protein Dalk_4570 [Desulfatibacillum aliphaticivorans]|uniref:Terminase small subunit protein n=1 Tax=Desulfatibacillum aliphaticivorans TaxID=218208 RepID=B8FNG7_DESAL|nr:hypothetical protein [Desulfatibacillum aliphaticivorans]ACL06248.1 hypothetical protein Dalk_4570 [Desulfatibacillum aliphaticivorans]
MAAGRPSAYTDEIAETICERIASGESVQSITSDEDMPSSAMVYRWLADARYSKFREMYTRARERQADFFADEIITIADTEDNPKKAAVRVQARQWAASKLKPRKYGDRIDVHQQGTVTHTIAPDMIEGLKQIAAKFSQGLLTQDAQEAEIIEIEPDLLAMPDQKSQSGADTGDCDQLETISPEELVNCTVGGESKD